MPTSASSPTAQSPQRAAQKRLPKSARIHKRRQKQANRKAAGLSH